MKKTGRLIFNRETLLFEKKEQARWSRALSNLAFIAGSMALAFLYVWGFTALSGAELPKTTYLKKQNAGLLSKIELLESQMDNAEQTLSALEMRDDRIYRSIFGLDAVPQLAPAEPAADPVASAAGRLDNLSRRAIAQSKALDEVSVMARDAGNMASCIPAISPMALDSKVRLTSPFGYRSDPITGRPKMHTGFDFACNVGNPVYATGDGVIESVSFQFFGYGNMVVINHGFGYKSRYAHLSEASVVEGMKVKRGDCIGLSGKSGRITGPHLHYEILYRGDFVNPANYFDTSMSLQEYNSMVRRRDLETKSMLSSPSVSSLKRR